MSPAKLPINDTVTKWLNHEDRNLRKDRHQAKVDTEAVFLNKAGKRLSTRSVSRRFEVYLEGLGLKGKVSPAHHPPYNSDSLVREWNGHQHHQGAARTQIAFNSDDLHAGHGEVEKGLARQDFFF